MAKKLFSMILVFCMIFSVCMTVGAEEAVAVSETAETKIPAAAFSGNEGSEDFTEGTTVTASINVTKAGKYVVWAESNGKNNQAISVTIDQTKYNPTLCANSYDQVIKHRMGVYDLAEGIHSVTVETTSALKITNIVIKCIDLMLSETETTTINAFDYVEYYTNDANYTDNNRGWGYAKFTGTAPYATYNVVVPKAGNYNFKVGLSNPDDRIGSVSVQNVTNGLSVSSEKAAGVAVSAKEDVQIGEIILNEGINTIRFVANARAGASIEDARIFSLSADYSPLTIGTEEVTIPATSFAGNSGSASFEAGTIATVSFDTEKAGKYQVLVQSDAKDTQAIELTIGETTLNPTLCSNSYEQNLHKIGVYDLGLGTQEVTIKAVTAQSITGLVIKCVDIPLSETETTVISAFDYTDYFTPERNYTDNVKPWGYINLVGTAPYASFSVDAPKAGKYNFKVRLRDAGDKIGSVTIRNLANNSTAASEKAAALAVSTPEYVTIGEIILNKGVNTITLTTTARSGESIETANFYGLSADFVPLKAGVQELTIPAALFTDLTGGAEGNAFPAEATAKISFEAEKSGSYQFLVKTANTEISNAISITVGEQTQTASLANNEKKLYRVGAFALEKGAVEATITANAEMTIDAVLVKCIDFELSETAATYINGNEFISTGITSAYYEGQRNYGYVREDGVNGTGAIAFDSVGPSANYNVVAPADGEYDFRILVGSPAKYVMQVINNSDEGKIYTSSKVALNAADTGGNTYIITVKNVALKAGFNNLTIKTSAFHEDQTAGFMFLYNIAVQKFTEPLVEFAMMNDDGNIDEVESGDIGGVMALNGAYVGEEVTCIFAIYRTENGIKQLYKSAVQTFMATEDSTFIETIYDVDTSDGATYSAKMFALTTKNFSGQVKEF